MTISPYPGINVIWGDNAQGKTNILEGIYLLGNGKSFRTSINSRLIGEGSDRATIEGTVECNRVKNKISLGISPKGKTISLNEKEHKGAADIVATNRQVLFSPEEIALVKGPPLGRRNLIDRAVFLTDPSYLRRVQEYNRNLKQRNRLLKEGAKPVLLDPWTEGLVETGAAVRQFRFRFIQTFLPLLEEAYEHIAGDGESAAIDLPCCGETEDETAQLMREELHRHGAREHKIGSTLAGPHRDDPVLRLDALDIRHYGSQGQVRSFILAFKAALVRHLEQRTGARPILLLDDITSELDNRRKEKFFNFLLERQGQVFVTTTDPKALLPTGMPKARYFKVEQGRVSADHLKPRDV